MKKIAIVSGASSGIGLEIAKSLSQKNVIVYDFSRSGKANEFFKHITVDITNEEQVVNAVDEVFKNEGRIDIVVNNAGFGISGAIEFTETADAIRLFDANFFGTVRLNRAVIKYMRLAKSGRIVNISSVAAPAAIPFQSYYSASKSAINDYTLCLANELREFNITACAIQPGDIKTGFTASREKSSLGDDIYGGKITKSVEKMEKDEQNGVSPINAGKYITKIALKYSHRPIYSIGFTYKMICALLKLLPQTSANYLVGKLYM